MDVTVTISCRWHPLPSTTRRTPALPARRPDLALPRALFRARLFPGRGHLSSFYPCGASPFPPGPAFPTVAYSYSAISRLGYSPNAVLDRAYHITTGKGRSKTNIGLDKKSGPIPAFCFFFAFNPAVGQPWRRPTLPVESGAPEVGKIIILKTFIILSTKERTKYMSNLILPLSSLAMVPTPQLCQSSGALGFQPCLEPTPEVGPRSTPLPSTLGTKTVSVVPVPSPRCSVKGCVFPAPPHGRSECHYHELLRTEAELFQSHQPSHLLSLQAPFGIPEEAPDDSRQQDRKRQAAEREAFILDEAA